MHIVEGIASVWFYHLSETGRPAQPALCGETRVMQTLIPVTYWGKVSHIGEKYCHKCSELFKTNQIQQKGD